MRCYYFPIFHNGETQTDDVGELFGSAELAVEYRARVPPRSRGIRSRGGA